MPETAPTPSFAQLLRRLRRAAGLTQEQLALRAGLSPRTVSDLERGVIAAPRSDTLELLSDALALAPAARADVAAAVRRGRAPAEATDASTQHPALPAAPPTLHHSESLPPQPTAFIGREQEVDAVRSRLCDPQTRLLTLTGPGGVGKTRLAVQVAAAVRTAFADGVLFVSLASVGDPTAVLHSIAQALDVPEAPGQPLSDTLKSVLREKELLLVLDNFEQILPAAEAVQALVLGTTHLKVLVTSRAALHVRGERLHAVPPLAVPAPPLPPLAALSQYEAVRLFIARAQDVDPAFAVTNATAPAIAEICARLDGLPLAIELAAARVRLLPPDALLARLDRRLRIAAGGAQDVPARQRTLRAAIEWSESLLEPADRTLFARLAVFVGGTTLDAIEAVCSAPADRSSAPVDAIEGVASLLDKSLVRREIGPDGEPRFTMLETIHEYAADALVAAGDAALLGQAHAAYYLALAEMAAPHLASPAHAAWVARLEADDGNVTAALRWFLQHQDASQGLRLVGALSRYWETRSHIASGRGWVEAFLRLPGAVAAEIRAGALRTAGVLAAACGDAAAARTYLRESLVLFEQGTDRQQHAEALNNLGWLSYTSRSPQEAAPFFTQAHHLWTELDDPRGRSAALMGLGCLALVLGETQRGRQHLQESEALARESGDPYTIAHAAYNLGWACLACGDREQAMQSYAESLERFQALHDVRSVIMGLEGAAAVVAHRHPARAAQLLAAASAQRAAARAPQPDSDRARYESCMQAAREQLGAAEWEQASHVGETLSLEAAVQDALALLQNEA